MQIKSYKADGVEVIDIHEQINDLKDKLNDLENELDYVVKSELNESGRDFYELVNHLIGKNVLVTFKDYSVKGKLNRVHYIPMVNLEKLCIELEINGINYGTYDSFEIEEYKEVI